MIELEEAQRRIPACIPPPVTERIPLSEAHNRIATETVVSAIDLPPFDNSAMDGYAVRAADVAGAAPERSVRLRVRTRIPAGGRFDGEIGSGECARLFTGSAMPAGADAVVMQEDTRVEEAESVLILDAAKPFENVRLRGCDVKRGTESVRAGDVLTPGRIALLAATGIGEINVGRRPMVGLLATGSELREAGQRIAPGEIYESNRLMLAPLVRAAGGKAEVFPIVPDAAEATRSALTTAFDCTDIVLTCGGVSVGEMDFVKTAFEKIGGRIEFWKVAIRPGKPFVFGRLKEKFLFGLPGNPVSAFVTFLVLVRPVIRRWQGAADIELPRRQGVLAEPVTNRGERRHFVRVRMDAEGKVYSVGLQMSHAVSALAAANGLLDVPPHADYSVGQPVPVLVWE